MSHLDQNGSKTESWKNTEVKHIVCFVQAVVSVVWPGDVAASCIQPCLGTLRLLSRYIPQTAFIGALVFE
jgi:hypothetical protein